MPASAAAGEGGAETAEGVSEFTSRAARRGTALKGAATPVEAAERWEIPVKRRAPLAIAAGAVEADAADAIFIRLRASFSNGKVTKALCWKPVTPIP